MTPRHARASQAPVVSRRVFLGALGAGAVAAGTVAVGMSVAALSPSGGGGSPSPSGAAGGSATTPRTPAPSAGATAASAPEPTGTPTPSPTPEPPPAPAVPPLAKVPLPGGPLTELPGDGNLLAWTVDDGSNADVIRLYTEFAARSGTRLTFFVNGTYPGWSQHTALLAPLVRSGQIQLGNHTFDHADLTALSDAGVIDQLQRNHDFLLTTFGVDARPYFRPPYGYHDDRVDALAASIGYTCPVLWYGSLSDSGLITEQQVVDFATQWLLPQHIVIGHLNFLPVTNVFPQLEGIIASRGLRTVTLNDVFER